MSSTHPELVARQYNKYISQQSPSPTRQTAVKFLMTSKENPFGPPAGPDSDEEQDARPNRFNSARRNNFGGVTSEEFVAASPESGAKATMYNQLQQEIRDEARRTSQITPSTTSFQALLGYRSVSPSVSKAAVSATQVIESPFISQKNYDYAENAKSQLMHIGSQSPQLSRPLKKVNPYDCFRSGEARQSIVQCVAQVQRLVDQQNERAQESPQQPKRHGSPQGAHDSPEQSKVQPIQPYKRYRPAEDGPLTHAVPHQEPDPVETSHNMPQSSATKKRAKYTQLEQTPQTPAETNFSFGKQSRSKTFHEESPSRQTLGAQMLKKHRQQAQQQPAGSQSTVAWPSRQQQQAEPLTPGVHSSRSSQLIDFYQQKYSLRDLSRANQPQSPLHPSLAHTQLVSRPALARQHTTSYQVDELRHVNRDVIRSFGLGSLENLSQKFDNGNLTLDQMLRLQATTTSHVVQAQPTLGKTMTVQQMAVATKFHGAALQVQRHLRGYLARKEAAKEAKTYRFFKRVQRVALVNQLVHAMKSSFIQIKNTKQRYLKKYIFFSATRIQSAFKGFLARKYKVPIRQKLKGKCSRIEGVALGWRVRRIMKTREVQNRVAQIRDYEKALEETVKEARQVKSAEEREKLMQLVAQVRQSRATTILKLIQIVNKMQLRGQWLTLHAAEETDAELRTPRSSRQGEQVRLSQHRVAHTAPKPTQKDAQPSPNTSLLSAIPSMTRQNSLKAGAEVPSYTVQAAPQPIPSKPPSFKAASPTRGKQSPLGKSLLSEERKSYDRKYTISHNNSVQPNFTSSSYQEDARASFRKRMEYKPSEAAKASKVQTDPDNYVSAYSQDQLNHSVDYGQMSRNLERAGVRQAAARHTVVTRSVELTGARRQGQTRTSRERGWKEPPVARSQFIIDGEMLTFSRYRDDKHVTREVEQRRMPKSKSRSRDPPAVEQPPAATQTQFSSSLLSMIKETKPQQSVIAERNSGSQQAASSALFSEIDTKIVRNSFAQATMKQDGKTKSRDEVVYLPATAPASGIKVFSRPPSGAKQSLFGSIEPKSAAVQEQSETFEKSTKTIKHTVIRNNPELEPQLQQASVRDFDFSTCPSKQVERQSISDPPVMTSKPDAPQTTVDKLASLALEGKFSSTESAPFSLSTHVQRTTNLVTSSANELLDMLQRRQAQTAVTPEKPAKKPSIFASAVANKKLQNPSASVEFGLTYASRNDTAQKAPSTATFGKTESASVASMKQQAGIKPYEKTRRPRNARTGTKPAKPAATTTIDQNINMFSPTQPLAYTPDAAQLITTPTSGASPKKSTIKTASKTPLKRRPSQNPAGLFRKSAAKTAKK